MMERPLLLVGCGKMGSAMVRRLASLGHRVIAWNRTAAAAEMLATESPNCTAAPSAADAIAGVADGPVILMLATIPAVQELLAQPAVRAALAGKTLVNIVSGNPDEGRAVAASVAGVAAVCIDGAYSGAPTKALYQILQGARAYLQARPVYYVLLEYYPKGLKAGGVDPLMMLRLLTLELGYQCFDVRCNPKRGHGGARTLEDFVRAYPSVAANEFGTWTDLLCTRFDLLR